MAALSLQGQPDRSGFVRAFSGSNHYILDYLLDEALAGQPPDVQAFLIQTAVFFDRLHGPLCVTRSPGARMGKRCWSGWSARTCS